jgi:hypothetical protein
MKPEYVKNIQIAISNFSSYGMWHSPSLCSHRLLSSLLSHISAGMHIDLFNEKLAKKMTEMLESSNTPIEIRTAICVALFHFSVFHGIY